MNTLLSLDFQDLPNNKKEPCILLTTSAKFNKGALLDDSRLRHTGWIFIMLLENLKKNRDSLCLLNICK